MGVRGVRRGKTESQIESQLKDAKDALLAVMNLLNRGPVTLTENSISYLAAVERRAESIRSRVSAAIAPAALPAAAETVGERADQEGEE